MTDRRTLRDMEGSGGSDHGADFTFTGPDGKPIVVEVKGAIDPETERMIRATADALKAAQSALEDAGVHISRSKRAVERARAR